MLILVTQKWEHSKIIGEQADNDANPSIFHHIERLRQVDTVSGGSKKTKQWSPSRQARKRDSGRCRPYSEEIGKLIKAYVGQEDNWEQPFTEGVSPKFLASLTGRSALWAKEEKWLP